MCSYLDLKRIKIKAMKKNKKGNHSERSIHLIWSIFWIIYNILGNKGRKKEKICTRINFRKSFQKKVHLIKHIVILVFQYLFMSDCLSLDVWFPVLRLRKLILWLETSIFSRWLTEKTIFQIYYFFFYNKFYFKKRVN